MSQVVQVLSKIGALSTAAALHAARHHSCGECILMHWHDVGAWLPRCLLTRA